MSGGEGEKIGIFRECPSPGGMTARKRKRKLLGGRGQRCYLEMLCLVKAVGYAGVISGLANALEVEWFMAMT